MFRLVDIALPKQVIEESCSVLLTVIRRGWNSWWKFRRSCLRPSCCRSPSRTLTFQFLGMVFLATEVFKAFHPGQSSLQPTLELIAEIPVPYGGFQDFPHFCLRSPFQRGFSHSSQAEKSAKVTRQSSARVPGHSSSSELSAHHMARAGDARDDTLEGLFIDLAGGEWMRMDTGLWLLLGTDTYRAESG